MSKKIKDTEYAFISAYLRAGEAKLVSRERLERMIEAPTAAEALRLLEECGYGDMTGVGVRELEIRLAERRNAAMSELASLAPAPEITDVFRVKYDYHNAKALVKAAGAGTDAAAILSPAGRFAPEDVAAALKGEEGEEISAVLAAAMAEARDTLAATGDPQLADFILDKAYFAEMKAEADKVHSAFLAGYVRLNVDAANLRSAVRVLRMGKNASLLRQALIDGGSVGADELIAAASAGEPFAPLFVNELHDAARLGDETAAGRSLTAFERECDNAVVRYMAGAQTKSFGEEVPVGYLFAVESEIAAVRTVATGRIAGIEPDTIRERLRELAV